MTETVHDHLERDLRALFGEQGRRVTPTHAEWDPNATVTVVDLDSARVGGRRRVGAAAIGLASAAAMIAIGLVAVSVVGSSHSAVKTHPSVGGAGPSGVDLPPGSCADGRTPATYPCSAAVQWDTPQVHLEGKEFSILTVGKTGAGDFTAKDPKIEIHSDPGDAHYQTLELTWHENGVEQRWYIYFASDGKDWWVTEMRTYDGNSRTEWVYFKDSPYFRTPLGAAWSGTLDVTAADHGVTSHLRMQIAQLQPFLSHGNPLPNESASAS